MSKQPALSVLCVLGLTLLAACGGSSSDGSGAGERVTLLNVSYDPTRELYRDVNEGFVQEWQKSTGQQVTIKQSHGGSGSQARAVIDGLPADVVTLALAYDIDSIQRKGKRLGANWQTRFPEQQRAVHLDDRVPGAQGQSEADPRLARPAQARRRDRDAESENLGRRALELSRRVGRRAAAPAGRRPDEAGRSGRREGCRRRAGRRARSSWPRCIKRAPVLDSGARGATNTFVQREIGDVLLAWENEALLAIRELGPDKVEIVVPSISILAEPPVAVVDTVVDRRGTRQIAEAYLRYLYSPPGQEIAAKHYFRPRNAAAAREVSRAVRADRAVHRRRGVRRLDRGARPALRRRRRVRQDLRGRRVRERRHVPPPSILPGFGLTLGFSTFFLSAIVLIPLAALVAEDGDDGLGRFRATC